MLISCRLHTDGTVELVRAFETIADRRIREGRAAGAFDDLPGAGKPIPDLGRERPAGWWAARVVRRDRSMARADQLDRNVRTAMPELWRLRNERDVEDRIDELNAEIDDYNRVTTWERRARLDRAVLVAKWRSYQ